MRITPTTNNIQVLAQSASIDLTLKEMGLFDNPKFSFWNINNLKIISSFNTSQNDHLSKILI
jgi:hypothetical protein